MAADIKGTGHPKIQIKISSHRLLKQFWSFTVKLLLHSAKQLKSKSESPNQSEKMILTDIFTAAAKSVSLTLYHQEEERRTLYHQEEERRTLYPQEEERRTGVTLMGELLL